MIVPFVIAMLHINDEGAGGEGVLNWPRYVALMVFLVMAISDGVDGWLARRDQSESRVGAFLDPLADKLLITCACLLLASPATGVRTMILPAWVVVIILGKDLYAVLGFIIVYLVTQELKVVPALAGKLSTALQLSLVLAILISPDAIRIFPWFGLFVKGLWWFTSGVAIATMIVYTRQGTRYVNEYEQRSKGSQP